jgi:hypothetical protein
MIIIPASKADTCPRRLMRIDTDHDLVEIIEGASGNGWLVFRRTIADVYSFFETMYGRLLDRMLEMIEMNIAGHIRERVDEYDRDPGCHDSRGI